MVHSEARTRFDDVTKNQPSITWISWIDIQMLYFPLIQEKVMVELGIAIGVSIRFGRLFSSPEPKAHMFALCYSWSGVRPSIRPQCSKIFSKTAWVGGTKVCSRHLGHMTKMAATTIYTVKTLQTSSPADFHETWYVASGTPAHQILFK